GAVHVYTRPAGGAWSRVAFIKPADAPSTFLFFGEAIALSGDGYTLAAGAEGHDTGASNAGAAYVFRRNNSNGSGWSQVPSVPIKPSNPMAGAGFGSAVAISGDGLTLAVGAFNEQANATGVSTGTGG